MLLGLFWWYREEEKPYIPLTDAELGNRRNSTRTATQIEETDGGLEPRYSASRSPTVKEEAANMAEEVLNEGKDESDRIDEDEAAATTGNEIAAVEQDEMSSSEVGGSSDESADDNDDDAVWQADPLYQEARSAR